MAKPQATMRVVYNKFPELIRQSPEKAKELVEKAAFELEARAKLEVPVDTGNLRNSIRTTFENGGFTGVVATNVEYAIYVEYGTRFMTARPYFTPAVEQVKASFERAIKDELVAL